jgi:hypothetical protein
LGGDLATEGSLALLGGVDAPVDVDLNRLEIQQMY